MEVLSPQNQSIDDYSSLDESWDSRLPTPLALDFSSLREEEDSIPNTQRGLSDVEGQDLYVDSLGYEDFSASPSGLNGYMAINGTRENDTDYLRMAKKGGGHADLLKVEPHTPTPEPVRYDKKDGQWYTHDGVDVKDTQQKKEMITLSRDQLSSSAKSSVDIETDTEYLQLAKKGGGRKDLLTVVPHTPTPEPVKYTKKDGQWYTQDGVDVKETQQRKDLSLALNGLLHNGDDAQLAAGGKHTDYLDLAKKGGGHKDLLSIQAHTPSPEPKQYEKKQWDWYNQDDMVIRDGPQDSGSGQNRRRTFSDSASECKAETEYLQTARKGGGHKDLLSMEPHLTSPEQVNYEKTDGQWYTHDGVDIKETQGRKEMVTLPKSPRPSSTASSIDIEIDTDYLKTAKKGGGHKDLLTVEPHKPTPEPVSYDKTDGQWYTHNGVDVKETQQRRDLSSSLNNSQECDVLAAGENCGEYLQLAKKGGGHKDLLTVEPHTPTPEPVRYDKKDGQWYSHDGVDVTETQKRKELAVSIEAQQGTKTLLAAGGNNTEYLDLAKKGGGHNDLLTISPHAPTPEPVRFDKKDGQWYTHDGVDIKETQQRIDSIVSLDDQKNSECVMAAGCNNREYLELAKKGGGHQDLLLVQPHTPTPEPVRYEKKDGEWYTHDGVDIKESQQRKDLSVTLESIPEDLSAAGEHNGDYLKTARQGGRKDLLTVEPHTPTPEPVRYDKKDGQWYTHNGVDVKDTQQRKEMVTVASSPRPANLDSSLEVDTETDYLKIAKKGGGHKDLLTVEPHTPSPEPQRYQKNGGDWYSQNNKDTTIGATVSPSSPSKGNNSSATDYLMLARKSGGHSAATRSPRKNTENSKVYNTNTEYLKMARKGGGHKDLLTMEAHTPSPKPQRYQKKGGDWYNQDYVDGSKTRGKKGTRNQNGDPPKETSTETEYLKRARKGGGHKDLLATEGHKPSPTPRNSESKLGDWYYHDGINGKESLQRKESPANSPRKSNVDSSPASSEYLKMAKKGGGHKDLLMMTPHQASPKQNQVKKQNTDAIPVNSPRTVSSSSRDSTEYLRLGRKGGGHPDLLNNSPRQSDSSVVNRSDAMDSSRKIEPNTSLRRSASMRHRGPVSDYLGIARKGGHHKDLLTMPETSNFRRDQESRRSLRSFRSPITSQVDGPPRPRTAEPRQPVWMGGSGPERVSTPVKRTLIAPFASHEGSPGAARNPDKI
ncbi:uncharacterized protein LOC113675743 isoform X9 [Pocillopora damicornis]|uniref:uncharacterized protein LOC113675743 isoform X9 n=1 Tax=Pocillopora damicornis TaxID=46731 RepID=UPI000F555D5F|nr:uncharacterized protein LOC113675743 isoform X9 [Pocillopora damicornis]